MIARAEATGTGEGRSRRGNVAGKVEIWIGLTVVTTLLAGAALWWARQGVAKARAALDAVAAGRVPRRQCRAQSYGVKSAGATQLRGLGHLALFDDELVFVQALASHHLRAKLTDVVQVTTPTSWLGKAGGVALLAVEWRDGDRADAVALRVPDLKGWLDDLGRAGVRVERS